MKIGMTYDLLTDWQVGEGEPADANAEFDSGETLEYIISALEEGGHEVVRIGNVKRLMERLPALGVDMVFNICEGYEGRNRESQVPILLEMYRVPFVGADALTQGISLDKVLAKKCFIADGLPTPRYFVASSVSDLDRMDHVTFPLFVKPLHEGTSKSLTEQSLVRDRAGLERQVKLLNEVYKQPALIEEFISGGEFTVPVLGNANAQAQGVIQVSIDGTTRLKDKFFTFELVRAAAGVDYICPANIDQALEKELKDIAVAAYHSIGCRDFGRVDFRVDEKGRPYILEINPLPSLAKKDVFNLFPKAMGSSYQEVVNRIIRLAAERNGLLEKNRENLEVIIN